MKSINNEARLIGVLYLLVIICAGFSQGYVRANLVVFGDAVTTAENILNNQGLFRLGFVSDIIAFLIDAVISVLLYQLFKPVGKTLAMVSSAFRLLAHPAIGSLNLLNHFMALEILGGPDLMSVFTLEQTQAMALQLMNAHRIGYLIAGAFFGIHCLLLGIQVFKSPLIPRVFGIMMIGAAAGYVMESFGDFLFPGNEEWLAWMVGLSAALGEVGLTFYLLMKGVRKSENVEPSKS